MFTVAFLLRLAIAPHYGFYGDLRLFQVWSQELRSVGTHHFYAADPQVDYPPGYLYVLWVIGKLSPVPGYLLLKLPAMIADLVLAWIAGTLAVRLAPASVTERIPLRGAVAAAVLFNPAVFGLSAGWGQVDSIAVCFMLGSFLLLLTGTQSFRRELIAAVLFGVAFSIKPQSTLASPVIAYALYLRYFHDKSRAEILEGVLKIVVLAAASLAIWVILGIPFGLSPAGLFHLYQRSSSMYSVTSANAFNFWGVIGFWLPDKTYRIAGLPASQFGLLVFILGTVFVVWQVHRSIKRGEDASRVIFLGAGILALLGYTFLTRMHERYAFLALASFAPLLFSRKIRWTYAALSVLFLLNLWWPYAGFNSEWRVPALAYQPWFDWIDGGLVRNAWQKKALSLAVTLITLAVALRSMRWIATVERHASKSSAPAATRDDKVWNRVARWVPLSVVGASCAFGLVVLRAQTKYAENLNDGALHLLMVRWASGQLHEGRVPFDGWFPYFALGSSFFHHYQSLPHTATALLSNVLGGSTESTYLWIQYLLLALWPISVFLSARLLEWDKWTAAGAALISPLLASIPGYGFEHESYVWQGYGVYSQEWGMWLLPLAWGFTWRAVTRGKNYAAAAAALALTIACHFITAYLGLLTIGVWVIVIGRSEFLRRFYRAAIAAIGALLVAAWVLVPLLTDMKYSAHSEFYNGTIFSDSYGARQILKWLITGQLFDAHRLPVVTLLCAVGIIVCLVRFRKDVRARAVLGAFVLSLFLFFGRPTYGKILDLLPGFSDIQVHRFIMGVDLAGIILAAIGLTWLLRAVYSSLLRFFSMSPTLARTFAVLLGMAILAPAFVERNRYHNDGATNMAAQRASDSTDGRSLDSLIAIVHRRDDGRVYAGLRGNWGHDYKIGFVPVHAWLANRQVDALGFSFRTVTSLSNDIEAAFDESNLAQYQMLNVRYVILPLDRQPSVPAQLIAESGRHRLYQVSTSGYFQLVDRAGTVFADRANIKAATNTFRNSDQALRGIYPGVAFSGGPAPPPTFKDVTPSGSAGDVLAQTHTLQDGIFNAAVSANRPTVVLLKATYDPRWTATVDGHAEKPVMMAPSLVGVDVASGIHNVTFRYKPYGWYPLLLAIGALTLLALTLVPRLSQKEKS